MVRTIFSHIVYENLVIKIAKIHYNGGVLCMFSLSFYIINVDLLHNCSNLNTIKCV
jgi:hypothetical protein